jgi:glutamine amidotransferase PdxT
MKVGVLALQGDFDAHRKRLEELGAEVVLVKKPEQLDEIDGLVIPGGESGTFLKLLGEAGFEKLKQFVRLKPTFGTCAGAILLANEVENPKGSAPSTSASAAMPTAATSTAPSAKADWAALRLKWFLFAHPKSSALART